MLQYDLIVGGGGPAGSTAAAIAARSGLRVLLLEAASHPRVHVGESLLPGIIPILERMGALSAIDGAGFTRKTGSTHWGWGRTPEWDLWFKDSETYHHAWLVDRSRFDTILFESAARAGAHVEENAAVKSFLREGERVVGVTFRRRGHDELVRATAPFTIDASGQAALMARELDLRSIIPGLQHECSWAHFEGSSRLPPPREAQALFIATTGQWMWQFPLGGDKASIGIIRLDRPDASDGDREQAFDKSVRENERLRGVIGPSARRATPVRTIRDWSYRLSRVCGPGWVLAGDASGFIDPVLSTGVHLAMHAAFHAASLIVAVARGEKTEAVALAEYQAQHEALFSDLLRIVRFFYQQTLNRDDYFWESKRILVNADTALRPQRAFMVLTSGLVRNLALDEKHADVTARRESSALDGTRPAIDTHDPEQLGFVCFHLRYVHAGSVDTLPKIEATPVSPGESLALYLLIEPIEPSAPSLFRTPSWQVNCLAPRLRNDPILVPEIAVHLRRLDDLIRRLDTVSHDSLAAFWRRSRATLLAAVRALPDEFELVRVFGE